MRDIGAPAAPLEEQIASTERILDDIRTGRVDPAGPWGAGRSGYGNAGDAAAAAATIRSSGLGYHRTLMHILAMMDSFCAEGATERGGNEE